MSSPIRTKYLAGIALLLGLLSGAALRACWYKLPLERDIGVYATIGHGLLSGKKLYIELWDHKPPGIHFVYSIAELLIGYGPDTALWLGLITGALTALLLTALTYEITRSVFSSIWCTIVAALLLTDPFLEGHQPNPELFMNCSIVAALLMLVKARGSSDEVSCHKFIALAGLLTAAAVLFKPTALIPLGLVFLLCFSPWKQLKFLTFALAFLVPVLAVCLYLHSEGVLNAAYAAVVNYNSNYSGSTLSNFTSLVSINGIFPRCALIMTPLFALTVGGLLRFRRSGYDSWPYLLVITFIVSSYLCIAVTGRFYNHYYQLLIPPFLLGGSLAIAQMRRTFRALTAGLTILLVAAYELSFLLLFPGQSFSVRRHGVIFVEAKEVGERLADSRSLFVWGAAPTIYPYAAKAAVTPLLFSSAALSGPVAEQLTSSTIAALQKESPEVVVVDRSTPQVAPASHPITKWINSRYSVTEQTPNFTVLRRDVVLNDGPK